MLEFFEGLGRCLQEDVFCRARSPCVRTAVAVHVVGSASGKCTRVISDCAWGAGRIPLPEFGIRSGQFRNFSSEPCGKTGISRGISGERRLRAGGDGGKSPLFATGALSATVLFRIG